MQPFQLCDCSLARCVTGRTCTNLRELLESLRIVADSVIEHHMMHCVLEDHFELYEFPNDLARWCWEALGDRLLGEQLGLIDPYRHASMAALRATLEEQTRERMPLAVCSPSSALTTCVIVMRLDQRPAQHARGYPATGAGGMRRPAVLSASRYSG